MTQTLKLMYPLLSLCIVGSVVLGVASESPVLTKSAIYSSLLVGILGLAYAATLVRTRRRTPGIVTGISGALFIISAVSWLTLKPSEINLTGVLFLLLAVIGAVTSSLLVKQRA